MDDPIRDGFNLPAPSVVVTSLDGSEYYSTAKGLIGAHERLVPLSDVAGIDDPTVYGGDNTFLGSILQRSDRLPGEVGGIMRDSLFDVDRLKAAYGTGNFPRVTAVTAIVRSGGEEHEAVIDQLEGDDTEGVCRPEYGTIGMAINGSPLEEFNNQLVDEIALAFTATRPDGSTFVVAQPVTALFSNPDEETGSPNIIITRGRDQDVVWRMIEGIDWYNEEGNYDDQKAWYDTKSH
jgi:hypothetical protein